MFAGVMFLKSDRYTRKPHVHLLLTSNLNYPSSFFYLTGKELHELERLWPSSCKITTAAQWNQEYIARYPTREKNMPLLERWNDNDNFADRWDLDFYRWAQLKRLQKNTPPNQPSTRNFRLRKPDGIIDSHPTLPLWLPAWCETDVDGQWYRYCSSIPD